MKILHLSATHNWGGGGIHLENLCYEMSRKHSDVENIILTAQNSQFHKRLAKSDIRFYTIPLSFNLDPRALWSFIKICKKEKADLIHIHGATSMALAVIADHFYNLPPFIFSKKTSFPIREKKGTQYKYNYRKLNKILCVSKATKAVAEKSVQKKERLQVIYHGTRIDNKDASTAFDLRQKLHLSQEKIIIGSIANHIEAKDLETLVRTADFLINEKKQKNLHFIQIGTFGKRTKKILDLSEKLGLKKHISFLGYLPNASGFIPQFDVSLITSENEGLPQVIYESFYYGTPVVSTNVGGISEAVENGVNGLLSDVYDYRSLGENILFLMENPQLIPTFAKISKEKLLRDFTTEKMAQKTLAAYKEVVNGF